MAGETVGMANVVRGVVQHGRMCKAGAENQERAEHEGKDTCDETIGKRTRLGGNCRMSHDNLRAAGNRDLWRSRARFVWQVSWLAGNGVLPRQRKRPRLPEVLGLCAWGTIRRKRGVPPRVAAMAASVAFRLFRPDSAPDTMSRLTIPARMNRWASAYPLYSRGVGRDENALIGSIPPIPF